MARRVAGRGRARCPRPRSSPPGRSPRSVRWRRAGSGGDRRWTTAGVGVRRGGCFDRLERRGAPAIHRRATASRGPGATTCAGPCRARARRRRAVSATSNGVTERGPGQRSTSGAPLAWRSKTSNPPVVSTSPAASWCPVVMARPASVAAVSTCTTSAVTNTPSMARPSGRGCRATTRAWPGVRRERGGRWRVGPVRSRTSCRTGRGPVPWRSSGRRVAGAGHCVAPPHRGGRGAASRWSPATRSGSGVHAVVVEHVARRQRREQVRGTLPSPWRRRAGGSSTAVGVADQEGWRARSSAQHFLGITGTGTTLTDGRLAPSMPSGSSASPVVTYTLAYGSSSPIRDTSATSLVVRPPWRTARRTPCTKRTPATRVAAAARSSVLHAHPERPAGRAEAGGLHCETAQRAVRRASIAQPSRQRREVRRQRAADTLLDLLAHLAGHQGDADRHDHLHPAGTTNEHLGGDQPAWVEPGAHRLEDVRVDGGRRHRRQPVGARHDHHRHRAGGVGRLEPDQPSSAAGRTGAARQPGRGRRPACATRCRGSRRR